MRELTETRCSNKQSASHRPKCSSILTVFHQNEDSLKTTWRSINLLEIPARLVCSIQKCTHQECQIWTCLKDREAAWSMIVTMVRKSMNLYLDRFLTPFKDKEIIIPLSMRDFPCKRLRVCTRRIRVIRDCQSQPKSHKVSSSTLLISNPPCHTVEWQRAKSKLTILNSLADLIFTLRDRQITIHRQPVTRINVLHRTPTVC